MSKLHAPQAGAIMNDEVKNGMKSAEAMPKEKWNAFVIKNNGSFLQSYEWGEFQKSVGREVRRLSGNDWQAQFIENNLPCVDKLYWHCPRGPVLAKGQEQMANSQIPEIIDAVKKSADKKVIFFRFGPEWLLGCHSERSEESLANASADKLRDPSDIVLGMTEKELKNIGFKQLPYDIEPSQTQILDITKTEDELLAQMHEKWRYNIRLAQKKGVEVKLSSSQDINFEQYFEEFYRLVSKGTSERKNIKHHSKEYYKKQLAINPSTTLRAGSQQFKEILFVAEYEGKVIAANIVVIFGNKATYLHGATGSEHREVMAPHLLQWEQIKYAKSQDCSEYDFWGIFNEHTLDRRGKSWEGFTRFKKGFGGQEVNYVGYWDYPLDKKWYSLYRLVQKFRR